MGIIKTEWTGQEVDVPRRTRILGTVHSLYGSLCPSGQERQGVCRLATDCFPPLPPLVHLSLLCPGARPGPLLSLEASL